MVHPLRGMGDAAFTTKRIEGGRVSKSFEITGIMVCGRSVNEEGITPLAMAEGAVATTWIAFRMDPSADHGAAFLAAAARFVEIQGEVMTARRPAVIEVEASPVEVGATLA